MKVKLWRHGNTKLTFLDEREQRSGGLGFVGTLLSHRQQPHQATSFLPPLCPVAFDAELAACVSACGLRVPVFGAGTGCALAGGRTIGWPPCPAAADLGLGACDSFCGFWVAVFGTGTGCALAGGRTTSWPLTVGFALLGVCAVFGNGTDPPITGLWSKTFVAWAWWNDVSWLPPLLAAASGRRSTA